jgi:hypothetical protein
MYHMSGAAWVGGRATNSIYQSIGLLVSFGLLDASRNFQNALFEFVLFRVP